MFPLIILDNTVVAYFWLMTYFYALMKYTINLGPCIDVKVKEGKEEGRGTRLEGSQLTLQLCCLAMAIIHACHYIIQPPEHLPFLCIIFFTTFAFCIFIGGFLFLHLVQWHLWDGLKQKLKIE